MLTLPKNPSACRLLRDEEARRLKALDPALWDDPDDCRICGRRKQFDAPSPDGPVTYQCNCREQWKLYRWMLNAGIGLRYQRMSWDDVKTVDPQVQLQVMEYVAAAPNMVSQGIGLTLWSPHRGTGKTLLGTLLLKSLMRDGYDCYMTQMIDMIDFSTSGWRDIEERNWFAAKIRNAGVLMIDDIGRESKGRENITESMLDSVIRARVAAQRPTMITTNLTPDELRSGYGSNVMSLLSEANLPINVSGTDYREKQNAITFDEAKRGLSRPITVA